MCSPKMKPTFRPPAPNYDFGFPVILTPNIITGIRMEFLHCKGIFGLASRCTSSQRQAGIHMAVLHFRAHQGDETQSDHTGQSFHERRNPTSHHGGERGGRGRPRAHCLLFSQDLSGAHALIFPSCGKEPQNINLRPDLNLGLGLNPDLIFKPI